MGVYCYIMDLEFKTNKLKKQCEDPRIAQKDFGSQIGFKLTMRVNELRAATSLKDIEVNKDVNGFHQLKGDRKDEFAVTLAQPFRLVFKVQQQISEDGIQYNDIKFIKIEEVGDYHGKNKRK